MQPVSAIPSFWHAGRLLCRSPLLSFSPSIRHGCHASALIRFCMASLPMRLQRYRMHLLFWMCSVLFLVSYRFLAYRHHILRACAFFLHPSRQTYRKRNSCLYYSFHLRLVIELLTRCQYSNTVYYATVSIYCGRNLQTVEGKGVNHESHRSD